MTGRIITARHGRPDLARDVTITAREYGDWWRQYDASGLAADERPPAGLVALADEAETILSSTLPRAIETARHVGGADRQIPADPMFVEAPLPPPPFPNFISLSPGQWGVVSRTLWFLGFAPEGVENHLQSWRRVRKITARLAELAEGGDVVLCAHGYLNWMIDQQLRRESWVRASRDGGNHFWSWRIYEPSGVKRGVESPAAAE